MSKIYCKDCKHLMEPEALNDGVGVTYTDYKCAHASNTITTDCWMCSKTEYAQKPSEKNDNNDCSHFEVKT